MLKQRTGELLGLEFAYLQVNNEKIFLGGPRVMMRRPCLEFPKRARQSKMGKKAGR